MTAGLVVVLLTLSPTGGDPFSAGLLTWLIGLAATVAHPDRMVAGRRTTRHRPADRRSAAPVPVPLLDPHRQGSERDA
jgi:hypothetical protein